MNARTCFVTEALLQKYKDGLLDSDGRERPAVVNENKEQFYKAKVFFCMAS